MTSSIDSSPLFRLPAELIQHVLSYLEPFDLVCVAQTCKRLRTHSYDDQIWQPLINRNVSDAVTSPKPLESFRELYIAHHPHWFLTEHRLWFADSEPSGKLVVARYDQSTGSIVGYAVVATRGTHKLQLWEKDREVMIHSFDPKVSLDLHQPVLKLSPDSVRTDDQPNQHPSDRGYGPPSRYSNEIVMETFSEAGLYGSFMFCKPLPEGAYSESTLLWPPMRFPAHARTRNQSHDGFSSAGHRPTKLNEISTHSFRLRKWVEYTGRRSGPTVSFNSNAISTALGMAGSYFTAGIRNHLGRGVSIRMPEDITTYAALPVSCYTPTADKPWQGIWCGDYSGHGCEFLVVHQPDKQDERPLPRGLEWLEQWFDGERGGDSMDAAAQDELDYTDAARDHADASVLDEEGEVEDEYGEAEAAAATLRNFAAASSTRQRQNDYKDVPTGRLEAIKLTGDPNIPRGEYTFIAPEIGHEGFMRIADEEIFQGARVVRSAGHIAAHGFRAGKLNVV